MTGWGNDPQHARLRHENNKLRAANMQLTKRNATLEAENRRHLATIRAEEAARIVVMEELIDTHRDFVALTQEREAT